MNEEIQNTIDLYDADRISRRELAQRLMLLTAGLGGVTTLLNAGEAHAAGRARKQLISRVTNMNYTMQQKTTIEAGRNAFASRWVQFPTNFAQRSPFPNQLDHEKWLFDSPVSEPNHPGDLKSISKAKGGGAADDPTDGRRSLYETKNNNPPAAPSDDEVDRIREILDAAENTELKVLYNTSTLNSTWETDDVFHVLRAAINYELDEAKIQAVAMFVKWVWAQAGNKPADNNLAWQSKGKEFLQKLASQYWPHCPTPANGGVLPSTDAGRDSIWGTFYDKTMATPGPCPLAEGISETVAYAGGTPQEGDGWY